MFHNNRNCAVQYSPIDDVEWTTVNYYDHCVRHDDNLLNCTETIGLESYRDTYVELFFFGKK